jgi:hypothetical protein
MILKKIRVAIKKTVGPKMERLAKEETAEQLSKKYGDLYRVEDEERRKLVLEKWNDAVLPEIEKTLENKDVEAFFIIVSSGHFPSRGKAYEAANSGFNNLLLPLISGLTQASHLYNMFSGFSSSPFKSSIARVYENFSMQEVKKANSSKDFEDIAYQIYKEGQAIVELIHGWCAACESVQEIKNLKAFLRVRSRGSEEVNEKVDTLLFYFIPKTTDAETAKFYYEFAESGSVTQMLAFEKWVDLWKTPQEAQEAYNKAPQNKTACSLTAYKKVKKLAYTAT